MLIIISYDLIPTKHTAMEFYLHTALFCSVIFMLQLFVFRRHLMLICLVVNTLNRMHVQYDVSHHTKRDALFRAYNMISHLH